MTSAVDKWSPQTEPGLSAHLALFCFGLVGLATSAIGRPGAGFGPVGLATSAIGRPGASFGPVGRARQQVSGTDVLSILAINVQLFLYTGETNKSFYQ